MKNVNLRPIEDPDIEIFFAIQNEPGAHQKIALVDRDPTDRALFDANWNKFRLDPNLIMRTILYNDVVVGDIVSFVREQNEREVGYAISKSYWGNGIVSEALSQFLKIVLMRPLHAYTAGDNIGSMRVLAKNGFTETDRETVFSKSRGYDVEKVRFVLRE